MKWMLLPFDGMLLDVRIWLEREVQAIREVAGDVQQQFQLKSNRFDRQPIDYADRISALYY
jgi:hypothetical protein